MGILLPASLAGTGTSVALCISSSTSRLTDVAIDGAVAASMVAALVIEKKIAEENVKKVEEEMANKMLNFRRNERLYK